MQPFLKRQRVAEAWAWIDSAAKPLPPETVAIDSAYGRVLAEDIRSPGPVPRFRRAMMDGYAVVAEDTLGASVTNPVPLRLVGEVRPGEEPAFELGPGQAARIATGAALPPGANAVLPAEFAEEVSGTVFAQAPVAPFKHIGEVGEDVRPGDLVLPRGRRLRPQDVGLLSLLGVSYVPVVRRPEVRIFVTGNELLPAGSPPEGCRIPDANGPMLAALVSRDGGVLRERRLLPDDPEVIAQALCQPADVILVSGGSSVGHLDLVPQTLARLGEVVIHGLAMRPSSPAGMGRIGNALVFLLPGNPVSCLCAYDFFAGRAIRLLGGRGASWPYRSIRLPLRQKITSALGRMDYVRVSIVDGQVEPLAVFGAAILSSTTRADGFVLCPEEVEGYPAGAEVEVFLYNEC
ncbi:MAG: molybdopterin molybdotransferase MoeA [Thermoguttaceae bacterium]|nr:molybdopterin molybdotransferase MoeA [Thermoguttaceae bacterium]